MNTWSLTKKVKRPGGGYQCLMQMLSCRGMDKGEVSSGRKTDWRLGLSQLVCPEEPVWAVVAIPNHKGFFHVAFGHIQRVFEWF